MTTAEVTKPDGRPAMLEDTTFSSSDAEIYQSVSRAAVASVVLALAGLLAFWFGFLVVLSILGFVFAVIALRSISKFPDELQGKSLAICGAVVCALTAVIAPTYHTVIYMTEVPDGYERLQFSKLMGSKTDNQPPADALQFDGSKVFIKGYIHPTSMDNMMSKKFVLVPDLGTCCFGGQPPLTHMIEVSLAGDQYARKSFRKQKLAGTLRVNRAKKTVPGLDGVFYQLKADILK